MGFNKSKSKRDELMNIGLSLCQVIVDFPLDDDANVSVIAWTTTPWTLPSNLALVVNPDMDYVKVTGTVKVCTVCSLMQHRGQSKTFTLKWAIVVFFCCSNVLLAFLFFLSADNTTNRVYIMMEARLEALFKKPEEYTVLERFLILSVWTCNSDIVLNMYVIEV